MLEGEIREIDLVPRLIELWREAFTGAIRFEHDGIIKIIYFKGGDVISASTNDRADSVDEILMKAGKVSREHVKQALAKRKENETLGDALLNLGFITRKELTWARRFQVIGVIRSISDWPGGTFTIVSDYLPKREEGTIFSLPQLVVELTVTDTDRTKYERLLDGGRVVYDKVPGFETEFQRLGLNEDAEAVVSKIDGLRDASEVADASGQETFNAFKLIHGLSLLGLIRRGQAITPPAPAMGFEDAGAVSDAADIWATPTQFELDDEPPVPITPPPPPSPEIPPRAASPAFAPAPEPPVEAAEAKVEISFDEVLEAARKATPAPARPAPSSTATRRPTPVPVAAASRSSKGSRTMLIAALIGVAVLSAAGYFGLQLWKSRQAVRAVAAPVPPRPRPVLTQTTATAPPVTITAEPAPSGAPVSSPAPSVVAPVPAPVSAVVPKPAGEDTGAPRSSGPAQYPAMAKEFARTATGNFTIQFAIVCDPSNVTKALSSGGRNVWFTAISVKGRSCYRMFWGHYDTRESGARDLANLPAALRESKPAVVSIPR